MSTLHKHWIHPPYLRKPESFFFIFVQNPSIGQQPSITYLPWNCSTAIAANNFQLTFIQPMHLLVIHFGLADRPRLLSPTFTHLYTNLHAHHSGSLIAQNQTNRVSVVDGTSLWRSLPSGPEWHTHWVCYPVCQCSIPEISTRHHANHALSRTCETKHGTTYSSGPL